MEMSMIPRAVGSVRLLPNLLLLALLQQLFSSEHVGAVDIIFYSGSACSGSGYSFNGIGGQICCAASGNAVLVTSATSCTRSRVYRDGPCTTVVGTGPGKGNICWLGGSFTGAYWYAGCRRRSLLGEEETQTPACKSTLGKPSGIVFSESGNKGTWMLSSSNATELYSQMEKVPDQEKGNWLKSHGATFKPDVSA